MIGKKGEIMENCTQLTKNEALEKVFDCEPVINLIRNDDLFKKGMILTGWHHSHKLYKFSDELKKLIELLGKPVSKGLSFGDISFFEKTAIWPFAYKKEGAIFVVYLSKEGLSLEINKEAVKVIDEIYNILINTIVNKDNMPFMG